MENIFFGSFLLIQLPPFSIFSFVNTHILAKLLLLVVFTYNVLFNRKILKFLWRYRIIITIFLFYFVSQSLSILSSLDIVAYIKKYEDLFFTSVFFLSLPFYITNKTSFKKIILILFFGLISNFIFQSIIYFFPVFFSKVISPYLDSGFVDLITFNINRSRIYFESYDEFLLPLIFALFITNRKQKIRILLLISIGLLLFFTFISGTRTKFLMYLFGFLSSLFLYIKNFKKYLAVFILFFLLIFYSIYRIQNINFGFSSIDRFLLEDYQEDAYTVTSRIDRWFQSVDIGVSHILSGVGLGNYSLYISNKEKQGIFLNVSSKKEFISASQDPHNIFFSTFAETGAVGLISFLVMLLYFFKKDIRILLLENHKFTKSLIIAFWTLFLYGIFNPTSMIKYQVDFFLMRFLIEFLYSKNSKLLSI